MNNIILIGFMGCGKTTAGQLLAKRLGYDFLDTDKYIEQKQGQPVSRIFETQGEEVFRRMETETVRDFVGILQRTVLSVGGGLPITPGNAALLKELGTVIYLDASKEVLAERLKSDTTRPLLVDKDGSNRMEVLYDYRLPRYEEAAHIKIVTEGKNLQEVVNSILESI